MVIFTALAVATALGIAAEGFAAGAIAFGLNAAVGLAASLGLSYAAKALAGAPPTTAATGNNFSVQGSLAAAGDVPRSFNVGYSVTAGSLVYVNTWGGDAATPNANLVQVIALSDVPGGKISEFWVDGVSVTLPDGGLGIGASDAGYQVPEYIKPRDTDFPDDTAPHLYIKYYDGTQTTADTYLTGTVSSTSYPYDTTRVGTGVAYVIVTSLVNDKLWTGFPTFKFALSGIPLYDPTADSTNGGSGSQRYSDPSTWGGDGDQLPAVQIYNILRGIKYGGNWLYGLQNATQARLPAVNWNEQIAKCRATTTGVAGLEPTYRSGVQITVDTQPVNAIETLLTACQGKISEIGGFYKIHLGVPDDPGAASFTDDDILSTETQTFTPFFGLADSVNGITASYPDPTQGWNTTVAPPLYDSTFEAQDGSRRLLANPTFDAVPYAEQVQRLMSSALQEARRARQHTIVMPPDYWIYEPGDTIAWTSARNGYEAKLFRIDGTIDQANLDTAFSLTEVDPTDYDWDHSADFTSPTSGPVILSRPQPQGILDWAATGFTLVNTDGSVQKPAIQLTWDGSQAGLNGILYQVRLASDNSPVIDGNTFNLTAGALIITQNLIPNTLYGVRGQYIPSSPRDMLWSDWLPATTPDERLSLAEFDDAVKYQVTTVTDFLNDKLDSATQQISTIVANQDARNWTDKQEIRSQLNSVTGDATASITALQIAATDAATAFASYQTTVTASFGAVNASVSTNSTAIATLDGYAAASYSVTLDVNNYATGFELVNGGAGVSSFTVTTDKFQIAAPGITGGAAVPIFTVANVGGTPKVALRGDMYVDGTITGTMIAAGTVTAVNITSGTITSASGVIGALGVQTLSIAGNAVTVPVGQKFTTPVTMVSTSQTATGGFTISVDTTGVAGATLKILYSMTSSFSLASGDSIRIQIKVNAVADSVIDVASPGGATNVTGTAVGIISWTATGGTDSFTFTTFGASALNSVSTVNSSTLWAVGAKR